MRFFKSFILTLIHGGINPLRQWHFSTTYPLVHVHVVQLYVYNQMSIMSILWVYNCWVILLFHPGICWGTSMNNLIKQHKIIWILISIALKRKQINKNMKTIWVFSFFNWQVYGKGSVKQIFCHNTDKYPLLSIKKIIYISFISG